MSEAAPSWAAISHLQVGRDAEYFCKMQMTLHGLEVYTAEVDDRGIDFVVRQAPDRFWTVQVKSVRKTKYVFLPKSTLQPSRTALFCLVRFSEGREPDLFLVASEVWLTPTSTFVDRNYDGLKSRPEYGINLTTKGEADLACYRFAESAERIFGPVTAGDDFAEA